MSALKLVVIVGDLAAPTLFKTMTKMKILTYMFSQQNQHVSMSQDHDPQNISPKVCCGIVFVVVVVVVLFKR